MLLKKLIIASLYLSLLACGGGGGSGSQSSTTPPPPPCTLPEAVGVQSNVQVSWTANREKAVNQAGGGYKVYYCNNSGYDLTTATSSTIDVPYVSGLSAPTTLVINNLYPGTYYFKVVAYSALNPPGGSTGSVSTASSEFSLAVP
jgi:hypothetical protein